MNTKKDLLRELNSRFQKKYDCGNQQQDCWLSSKLVKGISKD